MRIGGAVLQRVAGTHHVARLHLDVLAFGNQVLACLVVLGLPIDAIGRDHDLALALGVLAVAHQAVDLADDGVILRLARFEQLGHARQASSDVLDLRGVTWDTRDRVARRDLLAVLRHDVGADGQEIAGVELRPGDLDGFAGRRIDDGDARSQVGGARFDHDLARQTSDLVDLLDHGHAFDQVAELGDAADLGQNRRGEGIPFRDDRTGANARPVLGLQSGAVEQPMVLTLAAGVVHDNELAVSIHHDHRSVTLTHELRVAQTHRALCTGLERVLLDLAARRRATDMERTHRELRTGLADGLGRDDADGLTDVHAVAPREIASVAQGANTAARLACEHGTNDDLLDTRVLDGTHQSLVELGVCLGDHLARERVDHVLQCDAAENAVAERLNDFARLFELGHPDSV